MQRTIVSAAAAVLLAMSFAVAAQSPAPDPASSSEKARPRGERFDCSKAADPKACEERRQKAREAYSKANKACEGKQGDERRACLRTSLCAQAPDPAACTARGAQHEKRHAERRQAMEKAREACKGKQGDELKTCMRDQRPPHPARPAPKA